MWQPLKDMIKAIFGVDQSSEPKLVQHENFDKSDQTLDTKVAYRYPKKRSYRFPMPIDPPKKVEQMSRRSNRQVGEGERNSDANHKQPFRPTEVPSPIHGFRTVKESVDLDKPAYLRRSRQEHSDEVVESNPIPTETIAAEASEEGNILHNSASVSTTSEIQDVEDDNQVNTNEAIESEMDITQELTTPTERSKPTEVTERKTSTKSPYNVIMRPSDKHRQRQAEQSIQQSIHKAKPSLPPLHLLDDGGQQTKPDQAWVERQAKQLTETLMQFNVPARVVNAMQGPSVTRFEIQLDSGVKVSKVKNLSDDIKLNMAAKDVRIEAPIPGRNAIGIEIPNRVAQPVGLLDIFKSDQFTHADSSLTIGLGLDIEGKPVVTDIKRMPHGLIAGATGSGKSVCINSILVSLLYKASPKDVRLLLIDPKMVELAPYNAIPHLVSPVITDVKAATHALKWAVEEMEERYSKFVETGTRDIERYNAKMQRNQQADKMPYLVIIIDELADLMMAAPQDVEDSICRIAQKARACGIHLLLATQRPSVDVITGLIKANIPTRIAFSVASQVDSRTMLDTNGAERLLGKGDMLFVENGARTPLRVQGGYVSDEEIERVTHYVRQHHPTQYLFEQEQLLELIEQSDQEDELYHEALTFVVENEAVSTSLLQRKFKIGYNRAARLIDTLEAQGIISGQNGSKPRTLLVSKDELDLIR
ncbi:DNA translocase FtsK [Amphibacillus sediminis]|uniref:DNA translocase FtsK n=1 Tax=Amphibacillus sediminis TaxID=360185 RepID=UPI00082B5543|nr:DNA translocase FtsK [Amphibacillus sediminis]